jgi:hypothetical protein
MEEVSGSFAYKICEDGYVDFDDKEFFGECWTSLKCFKCNKSINYDWNEDNTKVIIKEEI